MLITHSCFARIEYSHALRSASFQQWPATRHKHHCATLREGNVARKRRFHESLRGRSRIDFPIRYPFLSVPFQSASWTLLEAVRYDRTRVTTRFWADYP